MKIHLITILALLMACGMDEGSKPTSGPLMPEDHNLEEPLDSPEAPEPSPFFDIEITGFWQGAEKGKGYTKITIELPFTPKEPLLMEYDVMLTNGSIYSWDDDQWRFPDINFIVESEMDGPMRVVIEEGVLNVDGYRNNRVEFSLDVNMTNPTVLIVPYDETLERGGRTAEATHSFKLYFSEPVYFMAPGEFITTNAEVIELTGEGSEYELTLTVKDLSQSYARFQTSSCYDAWDNYCYPTSFFFHYEP